MSLVCGLCLSVLWIVYCLHETVTDEKPLFWAALAALHAFFCGGYTVMLLNQTAREKRP